MAYFTDVDRRRSFYRAIPVYPEETDLRAIGRSVGRRELIHFITSLPSSAMICEDNGRYSWLSVEAKRKALKRLTDEKMRLKRKSDKEIAG